MPGSAYPRPKAGVTEELVGQELFLYAGAGGTAIPCLNSGAALIWFLCDGTRDPAAIARELALGFGLPQAEALPDVHSAVARLQALGLLETAAVSGMPELVITGKIHDRLARTR